LDGDLLDMNSRDDELCCCNIDWLLKTLSLDIIDIIRWEAFDRNVANPETENPTEL
jgi:hypothetical protein